MRHTWMSLLLCLFGWTSLTFAADSPRKIVLIAGPKSHGPVGNGIHDYPWSVKLLKVMLDNSNIAEQVRVEYHLDGWPSDPATLDDADTIMVISDGRDGDAYAEAPHFGSEEHLAQVQKQIDRGCGFCTFHFSTFAPDKYAKQIVDWSGGYFDWEENGQKKWYSAIQTHDTAIEIASPLHAISRGIKPFSMKEEFYFNVRFLPEGADPATVKAATPLLSVPVLPGREPDGKIVAWAKERTNGGRGFGTTCGHFYENWKVAEFRTLILNALAWTAKVEVPEGGVQARYFTHQEVTAALSGVKGTDKAQLDAEPIRVLLIAGNEAHKWHNWEQTTPVIKAQLELDPRVKVTVSTDPETAFTNLIQIQDVVLLNSYANWHDPKSLSPKAQQEFMDFLQDGGGLVVVHFANGAWNASLPMAGESDWPEYRKIVRRVWNHNGKGEAQSGHDAFGPFEVAVTKLPHEITAGLKGFPIVDELYFRQDGTDPIEPLITAHSKATNRDEPLAWVYTYGKGRVFQTLLGHSERTYEAFEANEMLRRATAWAANRKIIAFTADGAPPVPKAEPPKDAAAPAPKPTGKLVLVEGKFGQALDASKGGAYFAAHADHRNATVTVDCWTKLTSKEGYNILIASEPKSSATHWEMYSHAGSGHFAVYMPGRGGDYQTEVSIADGQWHHVVMVFEPGRLRLMVDGKVVLDKPLPPTKPAEAGPIAIGQLVEGTIGCAGLIDEVRFTRGVREFPELPTEAPLLDERQLATTLGLWHFDKLADGKSPDECKRKLDAFASAPPTAASTASPKTEQNHWGKEQVGFDWTEKNSVDGRWQESEIGRWLGSIVALPNGPVKKGLSIRVGDDQSATLCYDTQHCGLRAIWTGGFLKFDPARYGIIASPQPNGTLQMAIPEGPVWGSSKVQYRRMYSHEPRVVLEYTVDKRLVRESPWREADGVFSRQFEIAAGPEPIHLTLFSANPTLEAEIMKSGDTGRASIKLTEGAIKRRVVLITENRPTPMSIQIANNRAELTLPARDQPLRFKLLYSISFEDDTPTLTKLLPNVKTDPLAEWIAPGPARWTEKITTKGSTTFTGRHPYVLDTITIPFDNPYKALFFTTGVDFPTAGPVHDGIDPLTTAFVSTVHGDVWRVSGIDGALRELTWKRYATGLFQPLGLKVFHNEVYVLGRDQITRLRDRDGNGEADDYECFSNQYDTSSGGHDYVTCLEADSEGRFYFLHAKQGAVRTSPDGQSIEVIGTGLRNPNGMGLGPQGQLSASPQEGEWTPATGIFDILKGDHFGYPGPLAPHKLEHPLIALHDQLKAVGVEAPFTYIPRRIDNSSGGEVWVDSDHWGLPRGTMLHFSYGQCTMLQVLQERVSGPNGDSVLQGGTVQFPFVFDSGVCRGKFSPHDGQLYVTGLRGWTTAATQDGCLQRVRYTQSNPPYLPDSIKTYKNGLAVHFPGYIGNDIEDQTNYHVEAWNYKYSQVYGSADYKLSNPNEQGRDEFLVKSATKLDRQTVFLEIEGLQPCCQLTIRFALRLEFMEQPTRGTLAYTLHRIPDEVIPETQIVRRIAPGTLPKEILDRLRPGLTEVLYLGKATDRRVVRLAATSHPPYTPASPWLPLGLTAYRKAGWLKVPERGVYHFRMLTNGHGQIRINGHQITDNQNVLPASDVGDVELHAGYNEIVIESGDPVLSKQKQGIGQQMRVLWSGPDFAEESLPPTALFHVHDQKLETRELIGEGRELIETMKCARCHAAPEGVHPKDAARWNSPETAGPSLQGVAARLKSDWVRDHLLASAPKAEEPLSDWTATRRSMPQLFDAQRGEDQQAVADLLAYLGEGVVEVAVQAPSIDEAFIARGRSLFEDLGCIACHVLDRKALIDGPAIGRTRRTLDHVGEKFHPAALKEFLKSPTALHPATRMPDFHLSEDEATALVALLHHPKPIKKSEIRPVGNAANGAKVYTARGCAACHGTREGGLAEVARQPALSFRNLGQGCLAESVPATSPRYVLTDRQRKAIQKCLENPGLPDSPESLTERVENLITRLNCVACHTRDLHTSPRAELIAEESESGLAPETLPQLTWTGEKLHETWVAKLLKGELKERPRPWLKARMPAFPAYAEVLAAGMAAQHGILDASDPSGPTPIPDGPNLGVQLLQNTGLDCRQCHALGNAPPTGDAKTLLAPGINFTLTKERMRYDFYRQWVLDPPRFDIGTRMPKLAADGKTTKVRHILDGDAAKQFDAIWEFLKAVESP